MQALDINARIALVRPVEAKYYTRCVWCGIAEGEGYRGGLGAPNLPPPWLRSVRDYTDIYLTGTSTAYAATNGPPPTPHHALGSGAPLPAARPMGGLLA